MQLQQMRRRVAMLAVAVIGGLILIGGIALLPPIIEAQTYGTRAGNATAWDLDIQSSTVPALDAAQHGSGYIAVFRDASAPVMAINDGGTTTFTGTVNLGNDVNFSSEITMSTGVLDLNDTYIDQDVGTENIGLMTTASAVVTYSSSTGGTFNAFIVGANETWFIHKVFFETNTSFDCTGDDCKLEVGIAADADGFLALADASLQSDFTEATGFSAGWAGIENGSAGAFTTDDGGPFVIEASSTPITITAFITETAGTTLSAGSGNLYIQYTRIQ